MKCAIRDSKKVINTPNDDIQNALYNFLLFEEIFTSNKIRNEIIDIMANRTEKRRKLSPSFGI